MEGEPVSAPVRGELRYGLELARLLADAAISSRCTRDATLTRSS